MPSTVIKHFEYLEESFTLKVIFQSGSEYHYRDVPLAEFNAMKHSYSKGYYLNQFIKPKYKVEKIK